MAMRKKIKGLSAEEIRNLNKDAIDDPLTMENFEEALNKIHSSVSQADLKKYQDWTQEFGTFTHVLIFC
jgi:katanin p60 ATPase-containing subunit A1